MEPRYSAKDSVEFLPPDIMRYTWRGDLEGASLDLSNEYTEAIRATGVKNVLLLCLVHEARGFAPGARKKIAELSRKKLWAATCVVGASFQVRVMIELIANAARLVDSNTPEFRFFDTEQQAFEWFTTIRAKLG